MGRICTSITTAVTTTVTERISSWVNQQQKKCSKKPWPLNWFCWFVTVFVEIINWVVKNIITYTTSIVCNFIMWFIGTILDLFIGLWCPKCHNWIKEWFLECPKIVGLTENPSKTNPGQFDFTFKCNCNCYKSKEISISAKTQEEAFELAKINCEKACI